MTIQELLTELRIDYREAGGHHHTRSGWIQIRECPFCHSDNYHLGWNLAKSYASCWRCGSHRPEKVLGALGVAPREIKQVVRYIDAPAEFKRAITLRQLKEPASKGKLAICHKHYLRSRGFTKLEIARLEELWQVQGIQFATKLAWRLYIPIAHRGVRVSWTTRAIGDKVQQRYISASEEQEVISHKQLVYGMDFCSHSIVITEGPFDAWRIGPGAGALFGTMFTTTQVKLLTTIPRRYVCFDSSPEAQRKAKELARQLANFPGLTENLLIDAKDPGEASEKELRLIRKAARL